MRWTEQHLFECIESGDIGGVRSLLDADPSLATYVSADGVTFLHTAAAADMPEVVAELLSHGALIAAYDSEGETPLITACRSGALAAADRLCHAGARIDQGDDHWGYPPLFWAIIDDNMTVLQWLLDHGAAPHVVARDGWTALHVAAAHCRPQAASALLGIGLSATLVDDDDMTPEDVAMASGCPEVLCLLRAEGRG